MPTLQFYCVLCGAALQVSSESRHDLIKCVCCGRYVPVPRPVNPGGDVMSYQPIFPPDVLELTVKFECTACGSVLRADARCEGRDAPCPDCQAKTRIPRWSNVANWPRFAEAGEKARPLAGVKAPTLSIEEIDYLRGVDTRKPEAAA